MASRLGERGGGLEREFLGLMRSEEAGAWVRGAKIL